jgi:hypothetical protein
MNDSGFPSTRELLIGLALTSPLLLVLAFVVDLITG